MTEQLSSQEIINSKKLELISLCKNKLKSTDWQANAFIKRKRPIDSWVAKHDQDIVNLMNQINACTSLEELNNINF